LLGFEGRNERIKDDKFGFNFHRFVFPTFISYQEL
jgi:hypothetical protein